MSIGIVLLVMVLVFLGYAVTVYNTLARLKTQIMASIQEIGNQLKRQASLIPNLQESVKGYLSHEKGIYDMIASARSAVDKAGKTNNLDDVDKAATQLQNVVPQLKIMIESNPELQANSTVMKFMDELTDTADKLSYARRSLIDLTQSYNEKLVTVPSSLIANIFGFKPEKGLSTPTTGAHVEVSAKETQDVSVKL